jgi:hypothetical protein
MSHLLLGKSDSLPFADWVLGIQRMTPTQRRGLVWVQDGCKPGFRPHGHTIRSLVGRRLIAATGDTHKPFRLRSIYRVAP